MVSVPIEGTGGAGGAGLELVLDEGAEVPVGLFFSYPCLLRYNLHMVNLPFLMCIPRQLDRCT